jgi:uncharacterized membrane protein YidH (DUF202 family)
MPPEPALANERTALGWQRSALALGVIAAVLLGNAVDRGEPGAAAAALLVGVGAACVGALGRRLYRQRAGAPRGPASGPLLVVSLVTLLAALVAAAVVIGGS